MDECKPTCVHGLIGSAFQMALWEAIDNGEAADRRMSDFQFATNFDTVEDVMNDAVDDVSNVVKDCGVPRNEKFDIMEEYWHSMIKEGRFEKLSKEVEDL